MLQSSQMLLASNNPQTQNFSLLLEELISLLNQFPDEKPPHDTRSKTLHAVFLVRIFSKFLIENCLPQHLYVHFQPQKQIPTIDGGKQPVQPSSNPVAPPITIENMPSPIKEG